MGHAYETLSLGLLANIRDKVEAAGSDPRARLSAYFRASLSAPVLERSTLRTWVVFWGMIDHSTIMTEVHDRTYGEYRRLLETLLADLWTASGRPMPDLRLAAIGLIAIHDGLWLEWCLNPQTFSSEEAIGLCEQWTDAMLATQSVSGAVIQN